MWRIITVEDYVRIPPSRFGEPLDKVAYEQLKARYEGKVERDIGVFVKILSLEVSRKGIITFGDGATYHKVRLKVLVFTPLNNEIVEGDVVETTEYGAFVRIGPVRGLLHKTQMMNDNIVLYDKASGTFIGEKTKRKLGKGDIVRVRIVSVSYVITSTGLGVRIGLTARQPFLGKPEWIEEDIQAMRKKVAKTGAGKQ
ncbi:MAG: DNA-directed RNA polymerase [Crenarchaeota archaeon]|nr:DNA-directed RNA polymerase [Thermoproteota archaeon]